MRSLLEKSFSTPGDLTVWIAVFVLPINSAINPILYTFSTPQVRGILKPKFQQFWTFLMGKCGRTANNEVCQPTPGDQQEGEPGGQGEAKEDNKRHGQKEGKSEQGGKTEDHKGSEKQLAKTDQRKPRLDPKECKKQKVELEQREEPKGDHRKAGEQQVEVEKEKESAEDQEESKQKIDEDTDDELAEHEQLINDKGSVELIAQLQQMQLDASKVSHKRDLNFELKKIASGKGLRIVDNEGSGNCMFYALSDQLEMALRIKIKHDELRQILVQYLRKNPKLPDETNLFHFVHGHQSWADYLRYMEQDGAWGDHVILCAAANCYKTCIRVVSSLNAAHDVILLPQCPVDKSRTLLLGHIHEVHYVSLHFTQGEGEPDSDFPDTTGRESPRAPLATSDDDHDLDEPAEHEKLITDKDNPDDNFPEATGREPPRAPLATFDDDHDLDEFVDMLQETVL
ncbi:uncharacterized protein LOC111346274 [Stylophora pistillata]|nr:uncharacterized protein LOC111346274 [Stylophora pistillata]